MSDTYVTIDGEEYTREGLLFKKLDTIIALLEKIQEQTQYQYIAQGSLAYRFRVNTDTEKWETVP